MKYSFEIDEFDSKLFGFKVAKITHIENDGVADVVDALKKQEIDYATYRLPADNFSLIHAMEQAGFVLVDGVIDFIISVKDITISPVSSVVIYEAKKEDIKALRKIAGEAFILNRFYWDPVIPKEKAPLIYESWIENSIIGQAADCVLVAEVEKQIAGFVTLEKKGPSAHSISSGQASSGQGHIPLLAVSADFQGQGVAKQLLNGAFATFRTWQIEQITIATTMLNVAALRAYSSAGFKITGSRLTFRWHR